MSQARFAPITASLLARKGSAMPSAMAPHHPAPVFVETPRPVTQAPAAPVQDNSDRDAHPPHDPSRPKKLFISLSHREHERLAIAAVKTGLDRHQLVRDALEAYFEQLSRDMRDGCACMSGAKACSCEA
ncbi:MAG: hypothetical protein JSR55_02025 [Proteobacteria bacterium]|nr:hypothetical protein [Pseudomonadota bacterium]